MALSRLSEDDDEENCESDTDESNDEEVDESTKKKVKWKDTYGHTKLRNRCNIITFKHSSVEAAAVSYLWKQRNIPQNETLYSFWSVIFA